MTEYTNKICPICEKRFGSHMATIKTDENTKFSSVIECMMKALDLEFSDLEEVNNNERR